MNRYLRYAAIIAITGAASAAVAKVVKAAHPALKGAETSSQAKLTLATARSTALKARPGRITDQEIEHEAGGTGLRYSFDIKNKGVAYEVGVDAGTGAVLENKLEGKNPD